jgi:hypothetical protein
LAVSVDGMVAPCLGIVAEVVVDVKGFVRKAIAFRAAAAFSRPPEMNPGILRPMPLSNWAILLKVKGMRRVPENTSRRP